MSKSKFDYMSQGYNGQTYAARLFDMEEIPDGKRMPDLRSRPGAFNPTLLLEVKTSAGDKKASLNDFQLHYSVRTERDYFFMFGEMPPELMAFRFSGVSSTTYYDGLERTDNSSNGDLEKPFHDLMLTFGDHYIFPGEFAFYNFAFEAARKDKESIRERIKKLKEIVRHSIYTGYGGRKTGGGAWQDLHFRDISALFHRDLNLTTPSGAQRLEAISEVYPAMGSWKRVQIPGPNNTSIYILAKPEHEGSFDVLLRDAVERTRPALEKVIEERRQASIIIEKIPVAEQLNLAQRLFFSEQDKSCIEYIKEHRPKLERLRLWLTENG